MDANKIRCAEDLQRLKFIVYGYRNLTDIEDATQSYLKKGYLGVSLYKSPFLLPSESFINLTLDQHIKFVSAGKFSLRLTQDGDVLLIINSPDTLNIDSKMCFTEVFEYRNDLEKYLETFDQRLKKTRGKIFLVGE